MESTSSVIKLSVAYFKEKNSLQLVEEPATMSLLMFLSSHFKQTFNKLLIAATGKFAFNLKII